MTITFRTPTDRDAGPLAKLCSQFGCPSTADDVSRRLADLQGPDDFVCAAVGESGDLIGWVHASVVRRLESDSYAEVGGMVVADGHRSQGIGAALLARAEAWAQAASLRSIRVRCNVVRERAHAFYLQAGYSQSKTAHVFHKSLAQREPRTDVRLSGDSAT